MRKQKVRIFSAALVACMVFSFAACGSTAEDETTTKEDNPFIFGDFTGAVGSENDGSGQDAPQSGRGQTQADTSQSSSTIRITFPEGYTLARMINKLVEQGVSTSDKLWAAATSAALASSSPLLTAQPSRGKRAFKLEGYLFPATYEFYKDASAEEIFQKILSTTQSKYASYQSRAQALGYNLDEIITMASIIEKEAGAHVNTDLNVSDRKLVASVLHNRLKNGDKLKCDCTITYVEYVLKDYAGKIGVSNYKDFAASYSTYKCAALPAGPICNPGAEAIEAALSPAKTDYFYFVSKDDVCYFAKTDTDHEALLKKFGITPVQ